MAIGKLDGAFDITAGHDHDGVNSKQISAADIIDVNQYWSERQTFSLTGAVGVDDDVSAELTGKTPGGGASTVGVVTTAPYNKCELRDSSTLTYIEDAGGQRVYARLTESAGVWTLTYYTNEAGVETAHNLASTNIDVFYVEVFDQDTRPTFGADSGYIASLDLTADIVDATASQPGKVSTSSQTFGGIKTFQDGITVEDLFSRPRLDVAGAASITALTYNPFVKITGATATTIRGISPGGDGKSIIIYNGTTSVLTITDEDAGATAGNRLHLPAATALSIGVDESVEFIYDSNQSRWVIKSGSGSGSGGGSGGVNFVTLDSTWQPTGQNNFNAETSIGDWLTYDDGTTSVPLDMTGGSPGAITLSQTTSLGEVLNGAGAFKIVKTASNAQGEGLSCVSYIPLGYRGQVASIQFPFKVISGTLVDGDLAVYAYDVSNGALLTPSNNSVVGTSNNFKMTVYIPPTAALIRIGFHFKSTSTNALTFTFDDFVFGPQEVVFGPSMTDWKPYTPTFTGFGTCSNISFNWRQVGGSIEIQGFFLEGTTTATEARISLPLGYSIKTGEVLGIRGQAGVGTGTNNDFSVIAEGGQSYMKFAFYNISALGPVTEPVNGNDMSSATNVSLFASFPIEGLSTNIVSQNTTSFWISNVLANGTRVTGTAPTQLGEYRSYLRDASASTYTETSGAPAISPSASDGIVIYTGGGFTAADGANNPSRYEIFIGKNKQYSLSYFSSAGKSGFISAHGGQWVANLAGNIKALGWEEQYNPVTGILNIIRPIVYGTAVEDGHAYIDGNGDYQSVVGQAIYFDILVSEKVIPVQMSGDWTGYTPIFTNAGTTSNVVFHWRYGGTKTIDIVGSVDFAAVVNGSDLQISLPTGFEIDSSFYVNQRPFGIATPSSASSSVFIGSGTGGDDFFVIRDQNNASNVSGSNSGGNTWTFNLQNIIVKTI